MAVVPEELQESKLEELNAEEQRTGQVITIHNTQAQPNTTTRPASDISYFQYGKGITQNFASGQPRQGRAF